MKLSIILTSLFITLSLTAQNIQGTFHEGEDIITFDDNRVGFELKGNDGFGLVFVGEGSYDIKEDFVIITTENYTGAKTTIKLNPATKKDTIQIQFFDQDGFSIKGIRAEFLNKSNKPIGLMTSNEHGIIYYKHDPKTSSIRVSDLLYDKTSFDYSPENDFTINLVKTRVLEDNTVIIKLEDATENEILFKLLSTDFKNNNPSLSQLKRLEKKNRAIIDRARKFEKQL